MAIKDRPYCHGNPTSQAPTLHSPVLLLPFLFPSSHVDIESILVELPVRSMTVISRKPVTLLSRCWHDSIGSNLTLEPLWLTLVFPFLSSKKRKKIMAFKWTISFDFYLSLFFRIVTFEEATISSFVGSPLSSEETSSFSCIELLIIEG